MAEVFLVLYFLTSGFVQKWYIPHGIGHGTSCVLQIIDTDRDNNLEFVFTRYAPGPFYLYFYELHLPDVWEADSLFLPYDHGLYAAGDFDNDGLYDLVLQFHCENPSLADGIVIFESPDSFSYPNQEVWRDTVGFALVQPISVYDVDKDGYSEIFKLGWKKPDNTYYPFGIYECVGNNDYDTIFMGTGVGALSSTMAFGDFDSDNLVEFVLGNIDGYYQIWECVGNNDYQLLQQQQLPTANIKDCFTVPDADGDGKLEFVVKGFTVPDAKIHPFILEATGDNTYEIVKSFTFSGGYDWYGGGYSEAGDVDGDSIPEIVLEGCQNIYIIKSAGNDSFFLWQTLLGNVTGSCIRVFDIDNNGLSEIVISGSNYTRIYEKTPFVTWFCPVPYDTFYPGDTVYPRWRLDETIGLDSLKVYWSHPQLGCHLIYCGSPNDTMCQWVAPDTQSNMAFRLWLTVKGFGRYDSTSSPPFYIKRVPGIEETNLRSTPYALRSLEVYPNPTKGVLRISYIVERNSVALYGRNSQEQAPTLQIYDATGRLIRQWNNATVGQGDHVVWDGTDDMGRRLPAGVYFVELAVGNYARLNKKVILMR